MNIDIKDAQDFAELEEKFGVPAPSSETMTEVFGPYYALRFGGFWCHEPRDEKWKICRESSREQRIAPSGLSEDDKDAFSEVARYVESIAPPKTPMDHGAFTAETAFLYEGFVFQWLYIPQLSRWELLSLGKHQA